MNSETLREARKYEEAVEQTISREEKPELHLAPRVGWMNDPNGYSIYNGQYHMFYQYHPYSPYWGPMHWGHAVSQDLLHWKNLPTALAPDTSYDKNGVFSGSAIELPDGRQLLMYTGVSQTMREDGGMDERQTQCIAIGDGVDYEKYEGNPVLTAADLPEGASKVDFRDPKIWRNHKGTYYCITGSRPKEGDGQILLYESEDCFNWKYKKILAANKDRYGKMWECPDFFPLNGKYILLTSPQDMLPEGLEYHTGNNTLCIIGTFDEEKEEFIEERNQSIDYGIDFYAPQTVLSPDGRRIMMGWMQNWDTCSQHEKTRKWFGQMTLPREIFLKDGRLYQIPIRELINLRQNEVIYKDVLVEDTAISLEGIEGRVVDLELNISTADSEEVFKEFAIRFAQDEKYYTEFSFRPWEEIVKIDRKFSGTRRAILHQRRAEVEGTKNGDLKLRLVLDRYSVEVFINDGMKAMSLTFYTPQTAKNISFVASGKVKFDIAKYDLVK